jgi:hypothetical protein
MSLLPTTAVIGQTTTTVGPNPGYVPTVAGPNGGKSDPLLGYRYVPADLFPAESDAPVNWDDFQYSYLFESRTPRSWVVYASSFVPQDEDSCRSLPRHIRRVNGKTRLTLPTYSSDGNLRLQTSVHPTALIVDNRLLFKFLFGRSPQSQRIFVEMPSSLDTKHVSALIACDTGETIVSGSAATKAELVELFRDSSDHGNLVMTAFAPSYNPEIAIDKLRGSGTIFVTTAQDPRTLEGLSFRAKEKVSVRGAAVPVVRSSSRITVEWIEKPGLRVSVSSETFPLEELVKVADGLVFKP